MMLTIFQIIALLMSVVIHEVSHGYMAYRLGDDTAKDAGRLTLNPIKHLDPIGSVLLPLILIFSGAKFFFAWAKPVPYNPYNLNDAINGPLKVAIAGPASNFGLLIFFGLIAKFLPITATVKLSLLQAFFMQGNTETLALMSGSLVNSIFIMTLIICMINAVLMVFNLIPIPPLDGSKILLRFLSEKAKMIFYQYETYGMIIVIGLIMLGAFDIILGPVINTVITLFFS